MLKKISLLGIVIIGALGSYYFFNQSETVEKLDPVLWVPNSAEIAVKVDVSNHYLTLMKELYNLDGQEQTDSSSVFLLLQELINEKGAGLDYLSPLYFYKKASDFGLLLKVKNSEKLLQFFNHQKQLLKPLNDSVYSIVETPYKVFFNSSVLGVFKETLPEKDSVPIVFSNESKALIQTVVNSGVYTNLQVEVDPTDLGWDVKTTRPTYKKQREESVYRLPKDNAFVDVFIADVKDPFLSKGYEKALQWIKFLGEINEPIQIQYLGKGEKVIKSISYEYNDDFEMEEVVKIEKVPAEKVRLLVNVTDKNKAKNLQKQVEEKLGFLFQYSIATEHYVLFSEKELIPEKELAISTLHAALTIKQTAELKAMAEQFQVKGFDLPIDSIVAKESVDDSNLVNNISIYLPEEDRGVFGLKSVISQVK